MTEIDSGMKAADVYKEAIYRNKQFQIGLRAREKSMLQLMKTNAKNEFARPNLKMSKKHLTIAICFCPIVS